MKKSNAHNKFLWERRPVLRLQQTAHKSIIRNIFYLGLN